MSVAALERRLKLVMELAERRRPGFERLILDHAQPGDQSIRIVLEIVVSCVFELHVHEYSSAGTRSP